MLSPVNLVPRKRIIEEGNDSQADLYITADAED